MPHADESRESDGERDRPIVHRTRTGEIIDSGTGLIKTVGGFSAQQAQTLAALGLTIFVCVAVLWLGSLMVQNQKDMSRQAQDGQREAVGLLARTIESESEKNRLAIDSNTKLVVGSTQAVAITIGKLQVTLTNLEQRLGTLEAKISKLAPPEPEMGVTAPAPHPKGQEHR